MAIDVNTIPTMAPGCRLHPTQPMLLVPEGALELSGPSRDVLMRINGELSIGAIVGELLQEYTDAPEVEVYADVMAFLEDLRGRGVLRLRT